MTVDSGTLVTPSIRLSHRLGEGGMGEVWVADHLNLERRVAVKLIHDLGQSESGRARFEREAKAAARIQNPHVVQIFDHGITPAGQPFITMELLSGESLSERIARGPVPPQELAAILVQTASALTTAHDSGVVHRDIKPPNIFLVKTPSEEPFVKLLDFGIAKLYSNQPGAVEAGSGSGSAPLTQTGALIGTPNYMSPEQLVTNEEVTLHTDIWSLGVVAYEALIGAPPFTGRTVVELCISISDSRFDRQLVPAQFLPWFERALAVAPGDRFSSAMEAAESFRALVEGQPSGMMQPTAATVGPEPTGLSPRLTWSLAVVGCILGAATVVVLTRGDDTSSATVHDAQAADEDTNKRGEARKEGSQPAPSSDRTAEPLPTSRTLGEPTPSATAAPTGGEVAAPPPTPRPPSAPPVPARCKDSCRTVGACGESGSRCVVRSSADCRQSNLCSEFGKCTKTGPSCLATSDADCAVSRACKSRADCGLSATRCAPTSPNHCRQSSLCSFWGKCTLSGAACIPGSDADCQASTVCKNTGQCVKNGASCQKK